MIEWWDKLSLRERGLVGAAGILLALWPTNNRDK